MAANPRIPELPQIAVIDGSMIIPVYDYVTDTTYFVTLQDILSIESGNDYRWDELNSYSIGEIATYNGKIWESLSNGNLGNIPFTGSTFWVEQSKSVGGLAPWAAGTYLDNGAIVTNNVTGRTEAYILIQPAPFVSANFLTELTLGKWKALSEETLAVYDGTASPIILSILGATRRSYKVQNINGARAWLMNNYDNLNTLTIFVNLTGGGGWDQDFSGIAGIVSDNGNWDSTTKIWSPIQAGLYKLTLEFNGSVFALSISNLFA